MSHANRLDRLEQVVQVIADDQLSLQKLIAEMATETRRGFDQIALRFAEADRRMTRTEEHARGLDERVDRLVLGIGELIRSGNAPRA